MLPFLQVGSFSLRLPGLVLLAGLWIALEMSAREGLRRGIPGDRVYSFGALTLIAGVLAARLSFVLAHLELYTRITPWTRALGAAFSPMTGTEIVWVGLVAAVALGAFLIWRWQLPPLVLADAFAPGAAIFAIAVGLANLLSGNAYGGETSLPWGINLYGARRYPTQIYFIIAAVLTLLVVRRLRPPAEPEEKRRRAKRRSREPALQRPPGTAMQTVVVILSAAILLIEPLRADSPVIGPGIRIWMVAALVALVGALAGFAAHTPPTARRSRR